MTWKLKRGVTWHDGKPFTADDVVFTADYAGDPATATVTVATYKDLKVEKIDSHTVRVTYAKPTPFWAEAFIGSFGHDPAQARLRALHRRQVAREPGQRQAGGHRARTSSSTSSRATCCAPRPIPATTCPTSPSSTRSRSRAAATRCRAARAVLQTGEFDFAWNLAVEDEILKRLEAGGKGKLVFLDGSDIEFISLNVTDPWNEVDGERASIKSKHPAFQRQGGARRDGAADRPQGRAGLHLRPRRHRHVELPEQPAALPQPEHEVRVQRRQGQPDPRGRGLEEGRRRHPRQGQRQAEVRLPDLGQPAAPEDARRSSRTPAARPASSSS